MATTKEESSATIDDTSSTSSRNLDEIQLATNFEQAPRLEMMTADAGSDGSVDLTGREGVPHSEVPGRGSASAANLLPPKPRGPQLWAVVFTIGGLYYLWTRVLGKSIKGLGSLGGHRVGNTTTSSGGSRSAANIQAARARQQERLQNASRAREMVQKARMQNVRERTNAATPNSAADANNGTGTPPAAAIRANQPRGGNVDKEKKRRDLYLRKKAELEKEEETRRKDAELGPGWRYREDPEAARRDGNPLNSMDPQAGGGGGRYKPQSCTKKKGG